MIVSLRLQKKIAVLLLTTIVTQLVAPSIAYALTSGPTQPEFSGFQPVAATDLVNKFTGDFSYSIPVIEVPGPQGSSYPLTLAYHSGSSSEDESSWVGYGWNLNPGAINRSARGLPDDFHDEKITTYNKVPENFTITTGVSGGVEFFSHDRFNVSANINTAIRYNNYAGFGYDNGIGVSLGKGLISLGVSQSDGRRSYSARVNPMAILSLAQQDESKNASFLKNSLTKTFLQNSHSAFSTNIVGGNHGYLDYAEGNRPTQVSSYTGESYNVTLGATVNPAPVPVGATVNVSGSYSYQKNKESDEMNGYGYFYSAESNALKKSQINATEKNILSDYYMEKDSPYNVRDVFLGIPFNNADIYNVSGEEIGGTFQAYQPKVGEFGPNSKESKVTIYNLGADVSLGTTFGVGAKKSTGTHTLLESSWDEAQSKPLETFSSSTDTDKPYFRFVNDLGGNSGPAAATDEAVAAGINGSSITRSASLTQLQTVRPRPQQGSHIGQHTVADVQRGTLFQYCKRKDIAALRRLPLKANSTTTLQQKAIAEFSVTNEAGKEFVYGLPVYARNESTMQYGMQGVSAANIENNFLAYSTDKTTQVGELRSSPYATSYLLTEITSADYIDRTFDGPTKTDFGSYVAFGYTKKHGTADDDWYHWRFPFQGHVYARNSLSDPLDDMGSFSEGEKEIVQLQSVRTKTHTAVFGVSDRQDGIESLSGDNARTANPNPDLTGRRRLSKLDYIELYANGDVYQVTENGQTVWKPKLGVTPLKKVSFQYTYELCGGTLNSTAGGKLTLVSISTAYNGETTQKPYVFKYTYPDYTSYPEAYKNLFDIGYTGLAENPAYSKFSLDAWGNYQPDGESRHQNMRPWLNQGAYSTTSFDPAAWQLKQILLPSGGEIHVQYEQDEYAYVQDRTAHAMVALAPSQDVAGIPLEADYEYVVDPATAGIKDDEVAGCVSLLNELYVKPKQRVFFKFLYKLINNKIGVGINDCNVDFITGYVSLTGATQVVGSDGKKKIKLKIGDKNEEHTIPRQVCQDFVQTQRLGKLRTGSTCDPQQVGVDTKADAKQIVRQFGAWLKAVTLPKKEYLCTEINPVLSYFKLPLPTSKRGGGVRVKRLLTYDKGLDGIPVLYGSEYEYKAYDKLTGKWRSSGVATTEATAMREENALVAFIPRLSQSKPSKVIAGPDLKQSEGPVGESLLPGAAVGYSRVTVKNIHSGRTNPGYSITEYYTCKDFPMQWRKTDLVSRREYSTLFTGLLNTVTNNVRATQGFSFILNNMHGQLKREATYAGSYQDINSQVSSTLISEQIYSYFSPAQGEAVRIQDQPENAGRQVARQDFPGRDVEVTMAQRAVRDRTNDRSLEADVQFSYAGIFGILWITGKWSLSKFSSDFYTHTTSKVIRYPAIVKQVVSFHDGVRDTVENLAFDRYTGTPVAVKSSDAGRGAYLKQDVMASWVYPQVQGKAQNEGVVLNLPTSGQNPRPLFAELAAGPVSGALYLKAKDATDCTLLASIRKGDILALEQVNAQDEVLTTSNSTVYFAEAPDLASKKIRLYPYPANSAAPTGTSFQQVRIVASGNSNELQAKIGSTTYHRANRKLLALDVYTPYVGAASSDLLSQNLQKAIKDLPANFTNENSLLPGPYEHINISGFKDRLPVSCNTMNATDATISNLQFTFSKDVQNGTIKVQLVSFEINCGGVRTIR